MTKSHREITETHVTIGANVDFDAIFDKKFGGGPAGQWPVKKSAKVGEHVVILLPAMHGDLIAYGVIAGLPELGTWGNSSRYFAAVENLHPIDPPVPIAAVRQSFPDWGWAAYARSYTMVPQEISRAFLAIN